MAPLIVLAQQSPDDVDPGGLFLEVFTNLWRGFLAGIPRLAVALAVFLVFFVVATVVRRISRPRLERLRTPSFARVVSQLLAAGIIVVGLLTALPVAFANLDATAVLGGVSVIALAAGFAFQDIATNLMSGLLLVLREPFRAGDQVEVDGIRGTVVGISIRETQIRTFDGHVILVPNKDVYSNAIDIQTAGEAVRTSFVTGVAYGTDLAHAREVAIDTLGGIDGVLEEPAPQAYYADHGGSAVGLDLRYWTAPHQAEVRRVQDRVAQAVHDAFEDAGIDIPFDIVTLDADESFARVFASDGDGRRREGGRLVDLDREELLERARALGIDGAADLSTDDLRDVIRATRTG